MKRYQILKYYSAIEEPSNLKIFIAELSEVRYLDEAKLHPVFSLDDGDKFIFLYDSHVAEALRGQVITDPIDFDVENDFEQGEMDIDEDVSSEVIMHKDYLRAKRRLEQRIVRYDKLFTLTQKELNEIPRPLYEHLYEYRLENESMLTNDSFNSIAYTKKIVPSGLLNVTAPVIERIKEILVHNENIEDFKLVIEQGLKRTGFGVLKRGMSEEGPINYYETTIKSFTHSEQKILFFGLVKNSLGRNQSAIIRSTQGFWNLLLFVCVNLSEDVTIHYGPETYVRILFDRVTAIFGLTDNQLYQVDFKI